MAAPKGHERYGGKTKGTPNKVTKDQRELITAIIEKNTDKIQGWIEKVEQTDPKRAFDMVIGLMEFSLPKLKAIDHSFGNSDVTINVSIKKNEHQP